MSRSGARFAVLTLVFATLHGMILGAVFFFWLIGGVLGEVAAAPKSPAVSASGPLVIGLAGPFLAFQAVGLPPRLSYVLNSLVYGGAVAGLIVALTHRRRATPEKPPADAADLT
jgi:hypothetical protein